MTNITIGITSGRKHLNYQNWIQDAGEVNVIRLGHEENNFESIKKCDGIVLTGGEDIHPRIYNKPEYADAYTLDDPDEKRDEFELKVISYSQSHGLPLLGICRGMQITNAYFGGTLIPDIVSYNKPDHTKYEEGKDRYHAIDVVEKSLLAKIAGLHGEVNSAHHQAVDAPAGNLVISARAPDGIAEAMERNELNEGPFLLLVQWHPERMQDRENPFSKNLRTVFIQSVRERSPSVSKH